MEPKNSNNPKLLTDNEVAVKINNLENNFKNVKNIEGQYIGTGYEYNNKKGKVFYLDYNIIINIKNIRDNIYFIKTDYKNENQNYNYNSTKYGILKNNKIRLKTEHGYHELEFSDKKIYFCYSVNKHPIYDNLAGNYNLNKQ